MGGVSAMNTSPNGTQVRIHRPVNSSKVECSTCGARGYVWGRWLDGHGEHERCTCGAWVPLGRLGQHQGSKARHGKPCPGWKRKP